MVILFYDILIFMMEPTPGAGPVELPPPAGVKMFEDSPPGSLEPGKFGLRRMVQLDRDPPGVVGDLGEERM